MNWKRYKMSQHQLNKIENQKNKPILSPCFLKLSIKHNDAYHLISDPDLLVFRENNKQP